MCIKRVLLVILTIVSLFLVVTPPAPLSAAGEAGNGSRGVNSGGPISGRFPISVVSNAPTHTAETNPAVAHNSGSMNTYLVVWDQLNSDGSASVVYGRLVYSNGTLDSRNRISPDTGYNQYPDVAYNPTLDQHLVVYEVGGLGIYGQITTNTGVPVGPARSIVESVGSTYRQPAVVYSPTAGQYLVTWQRIQGTSMGIEARTLSGDGTTLGSILEITTLLPVVQPAEPDVAYNSALDQCLVIWQQWSSVSDTTQHDIWSQRISMTGGAHLEGSPIRVFDSTDDEVNPAVGALPVPGSAGGRYLVVAQQWYGGTTSYIDGWAVNGNSGDRAYHLAISPYAGYVPAVAGNEHTQEYLVAWTHDNFTLAGCTISFEGAIDPAHYLSGVFLSRPAIASGRQGDYLVAYQDMFASGYPTDVFGWRWGNRVFLPLVLRRS